MIRQLANAFGNVSAGTSKSIHGKESHIVAGAGVLAARIAQTYQDPVDAAFIPIEKQGFRLLLPKNRWTASTVHLLYHKFVPLNSLFSVEQLSEKVFSPS